MPTAELQRSKTDRMIMRALLAGVMALLIAVQVVRVAAVEALSNTRPAEALRFWSGHPGAELQAGLTAIATAARERRAVSSDAISRIFDAATKEPLSLDPFLVRGVQAQLSGNDALAERAFLAAQWRDGRSLPARYFLADLYFRRADSARGLAEIGALARLAPNGVQSLAPYVAAYAGDRATWPQLKAMFRLEPRLEQETLVAMAANPQNTEAVLALADRDRKGPSSSWLAPLLESLVKAGDYARARQVWSNVSRVPLERGALVFDPTFRRGDAPPPFNWALTSSTVGLAERQRGAGLHVIFYGQEDGPLASQLLVLPAGRYRLTTTSSGMPTNADALQWRLTCIGGSAPASSMPLSAAIAAAWNFTVPANCPAQRLELFGSSGDVPKQSEATIRNITLTSGPPNA